MNRLAIQRTMSREKTFNYFIHKNTGFRGQVMQNRTSVHKKGRFHGHTIPYFTAFYHFYLSLHGMLALDEL